MVKQSRRRLFFVFKLLDYKNADRRRQIALVARGCNCRDQLRHWDILELSDFFKLNPENILKANTSFASFELDGTFNDG